MSLSGHEIFLIHHNIQYPLIHNHHDDVIKWKNFPRYWPFVRGIHRSPVNSPHKGQWRGALMFTLIYARINGWVNNCEAGDLRRYHTHYDVIVMHNCQRHIAFYDITTSCRIPPSILFDIHLFCNAWCLIIWLREHCIFGFRFVLNAHWSVRD